MKLQDIKIGTPIFVRQKVTNFSRLVVGTPEEFKAHNESMTAWDLRRFKRFERHGVVVAYVQDCIDSSDAFYDEYSLEIPIK